MTKKCKCGHKTCMNRDLDLVSRFECNLCNIIYCPSHRLYEKHNCIVFNSQRNTSQLFTGELEKYLAIYNMNKLYDYEIKNNNNNKIKSN